MLTYEKRNLFGRVEIEEGEMFPEWYYGFAYVDYYTRTAVLYPIPINWVVRFSRWAWGKLSRPTFTDPIEKRESEIYERGRQDGFKSGRSVGVKEGRQQKEYEIRQNFREFKRKWNLDD